MKAIRRHRKRKAKAALRHYENRPVKDLRSTLEGWQPLQPTAEVQDLHKRGLAANECFHVKGMSCWKNERVFAVLVEGHEGQLHLCIAPLTTQTTDWATNQQVKNELVGKEQEMVELYPAESRIVNAQHVYHLWGVRGVKLPFGWGAEKPEEPEV